MKKILVLLFAAIVALVENCPAQDTTINCNPDFHIYEYSQGYSFIPVYFGDSSVVTVHSWNFGDGVVSNDREPIHQYANFGYYWVSHTVKRLTRNGVPICEDSAMQVVSYLCNITSSFSFTRDSLKQNKIYFNNTSISNTGIDSVRWSFGDGTFSNDVNPSHTYTASGLFNVCLTVKGKSCYDDTCFAIQVQAPSQNGCNLDADFTASADSSTLYKIKFTNLSKPLTSLDSVRWSFGDGTFSNEINPSHTFPGAGNYNVCLRIKKKTAPGAVSCVVEYCHPVEVKEGCYLYAYFYYEKDSIANNKPYTYAFHNPYYTSNDLDSVIWNFGDGSVLTSNELNPVHSFEKPGTYQVCLTIRQRSIVFPSMFCTATICKQIIVQATNSCPTNISFDWHTDGYFVQKIFFTNQTEGADSSAVAHWNFGDGSESITWNAEHTYAKAGYHNVCLRITQSDSCIKEYCSTIYIDSITPEPCSIMPSFSSHQDSLQHNKFYFINAAAISDYYVSFKWDFGDGKFSNEENPVHVYDSAGFYNVCLLIQRDSLCAKSTCQFVQAQIDDSCKLNANFIVQAGSGIKRLIFTNASIYTSPYTTAEWNFGDGNTSTTWNAEHTFQYTGYYNVCLKIRDSICESNICYTVYVDSFSNGTCNINASYYYYRDSMQLNQIHFINTSYNRQDGDNFIWNFGDGTISNDINSSHVFAAAGQYQVCLTMRQDSACASDTCMVIQVLATDSCTVRADFTMSFEENNPYKIRLNNTSKNAAKIKSVFWTFGDGHSSDKFSPTHQYTAPGIYYICLREESLKNCVSTKYDSVVITQPAINCDSSSAKFTYRRDGYLPNKIYFFANESKPGMQYNWTIYALSGNAPTTKLTDANPVYTFSDTGYYWVCLKTIDKKGCTNEYCESIIITDTTSVAQCILQAYPNPAHNNLYVNLELTKPGKIEISIFNMQNILLQQQTKQGAKGNNKVEVNLQRFVPGFYVMRLVYGDKICYAKFQKI